MFSARLLIQRREKSWTTIPPSRKALCKRPSSHSQSRSSKPDHLPQPDPQDHDCEHKPSEVPVVAQTSSSGPNGRTSAREHLRPRIRPPPKRHLRATKSIVAWQQRKNVLAPRPLLEMPEAIVTRLRRLRSYSRRFYSPSGNGGAAGVASATPAAAEDRDGREPVRSWRTRLPRRVHSNPSVRASKGGRPCLTFGTSFSAMCGLTGDLPVMPDPGPHALRVTITHRAECGLGRLPRPDEPAIGMRQRRPRPT